MNIDWNNFDFKVKLHLRLYIERVLQISASNPESIAPELIETINHAIREHPELLEVYDNAEDIALHKEFTSRESS